ncbi:N-methyltransferase tcpN [Apiospora arundinis]
MAATNDTSSSKPLYTLNHTNEVETNRLDGNHYNLYLPMQGGRSVPPPHRVVSGVGQGRRPRHRRGHGHGRLPQDAGGAGAQHQAARRLRPGHVQVHRPQGPAGPHQAARRRRHQALSQGDGHGGLLRFGPRPPPVLLLARRRVAPRRPGHGRPAQARRPHPLARGRLARLADHPPPLAFDEYLGHEIKRTMALGREPLPAFKLPGWFKDAGLRDIGKEVFNVLQDEKIQRLGADVLYTVCYQSALGVADQGDTPGLATRERVHELFRQIKLDFDAGLVGQEFRWVWGRKPHVGEPLEGGLPTPPTSSTRGSNDGAYGTTAASSSKGSHKGDEATPRTHKRKSSLFAWVRDALSSKEKEKEAGSKTAEPAAAPVEPATTTA